MYQAMQFTFQLHKVLPLSLKSTQHAGGAKQKMQVMFKRSSQGVCGSSKVVRHGKSSHLGGFQSSDFQIAAAHLDANKSNLALQQ